MLSHNFQVSSVFPSFWDHAGVEISNAWNCKKNWTYLWNIPLLLGHVVLTFLGYDPDKKLSATTCSWKLRTQHPQLEFAFTFCISITCMCRCNPTAKAMATVNCRPLSLVLISSLDNFMHLTSGEIRRPPTGVGGFYPTSKGDADEALFPRWCLYRISKVNLLLACSYNILQLYTVWKRIWPGYFGYSIQKVKTK